MGVSAVLDVAYTLLHDQAAETDRLTGLAGGEPHALDDFLDQMGDGGFGDGPVAGPADLAGWVSSANRAFGGAG